MGRLVPGCHLRVAGGICLTEPGHEPAFHHRKALASKSTGVGKYRRRNATGRRRRPKKGAPVSRRQLLHGRHAGAVIERKRAVSRGQPSADSSRLRPRRVRRRSRRGLRSRPACRRGRAPAHGAVRSACPFRQGDERSRALGATPRRPVRDRSPPHTIAEYAHGLLHAE